MATAKVYKYRVENGLCGQCGKVPPSDGKKDCSTCREYQATARAKRAKSGYFKEYGQEFRVKRNAEGKCYHCNQQAIEGKKSCSNCIAVQKKRRDSYKEICFEKYGGKCSCCGETTPQFLTIDHINNDGAEHRREIKNISIHHWLIKNNFPNDFRLLCFNCNCGRQLNGGICPHQSSPGYRCE